MARSHENDRKCYGQVCSMAAALDVVGDRWTLLILRELLGGPARFHELESGLPGIAKNLLTSRLRRLEGDGLVRRVSSHSTVLYALTDQGAAIRPTLEELGIWGSRLERVAPPVHDRSVRAIAMALHAILVRAGDSLPTETVVIELEIDGEHVEVVLGARPAVTTRTSTDADARIRVTAATMSAFLIGEPFKDEQFELMSGERATKAALLRALGALASIS